MKNKVTSIICVIAIIISQFSFITVIAEEMQLGQVVTLSSNKEILKENETVEITIVGDAMDLKSVQLSYLQTAFIETQRTQVNENTLNIVLTALSTGAFEIVGILDEQVVGVIPVTIEAMSAPTEELPEMEETEISKEEQRDSVGRPKTLDSVIESNLFSMPKDISNSIVLGTVNVQKLVGNSWVYVIKDGIVDETVKLSVGKKIQIDIGWSIPKLSKANEGDYFLINLPSEYVQFEDTVEKPVYDTLSGEEIGKWQVVNNQLKVTLTAIGASKLFMENGLISIFGELTKADNQARFPVGESLLPPIVIGESGKEVTYPELKTPTFTHKTGKQSVSENGIDIEWRIDVNQINAKKAFEGQSYDELKNVVITDDLVGDQVVKSVHLYAPLKYATPSGKMSSYDAFYRGISNQITKISENIGETYESFYSRIEHHPTPAMGVWKNTRIIVKLGDLPTGNASGLKNGKTDAQLDADLQELVANGKISQNQAETMFKAYSSESITNGDLLNLSILINTTVTGASGEYSNSATIKHSNGEETTNIETVDFQDGSGSATVGEPGDVIINKADGDTQEKLAGVEFKLQLFNEENKIYEDYPSPNSPTILTTDQEGNVHFQQLVKGRYQVVEVKPLVGYSNREEYPNGKTFEITGNEREAIQLVALNYLDLGSVKLVKTDKENGKKLAGVEFELQTETGQKISGPHSTNNEGEIRINNLAPGRYQLIETKTLEGYVLDASPQVFDIVTNQTSAFVLQVTNERWYGQVTITKKDKETSEKLEGAVFKIEKLEGNNPIPVSGGHVTNTLGSVKVTGLEEGNYQVIETKPPVGYQIDQTPKVFEVKQAQIEEVEVMMSNEKVLVELTKVDDVTWEPLDEAIFALYDASGKIVRSDIKTDVQGKLTVQKLAPGSYQFIEIYAPPGYQVESTPILFTVMEDQRTKISLIKTNKKKRIISLPDTKIDNKLNYQEVFPAKNAIETPAKSNEEQNSLPATTSSRPSIGKLPNTGERERSANRFILLFFTLVLINGYYWKKKVD